MPKQQKLYKESTPRIHPLDHATALIHALIQEELDEHPESEAVGMGTHFAHHWSNEKIPAPITTIYFKWNEIPYSKVYQYNELKDHERRLKKSGVLPRKQRMVRS